MFLQTAGLAGGAAVLAACASNGPPEETLDESNPTEGSADADNSSAEPTRPELNVIAGSFFHLTGDGQRIAFGLSDLENEPIQVDSVSVEIRAVDSGDMVSGPFTASFHDDLGDGYGLYVAHVDLPDAGSYLAHVDTGDLAGEQAISVTAPEDSEVPAPDDAAISTDTPTTDDDLGLEQMCTADPDCGMHEVSLAAALAEGRPVMLLFATPAYCQTVVCAPAVELLDEVRQSGDWDDAVFIHAEIYIDNGVSVADHVYDWDLPTEPWLFAIDRHGTVVDRVDGAVLRADAERLAGELV